MSAEILARVQFALTVAFHYIFPPLSIGLGLVIVIMEGTWLRTKNDQYRKMTHFWVKIFSLIFGIGVASGIVLEFQFGTNWSAYSRYVGDIFGSALAAEGVFAFFLESGFLAVLVFGWDRVSPKFHFFSTLMVWIGSTFSAVWIIVANSWMQTPAGFKIEGGRAVVTNFWQVVFNPSSVDRLLHTLTSAWMTGSFLVMSVSAYYLLKNRHTEFAKASMKIGLAVALFASIAQFVTGHKSIAGVAENQPAKLAALEGHWDGTKPLDLSLLGWVGKDSTTALGIPGGGSFLLYGNTGLAVQGLKDFKPEDRPPLQLTFQGYHIMIMLGTAMLGLVLLAAFHLKRGTLWNNQLVLKLLVIGVLGPQLANQAGWMAAEVGRQPWIVYGILRTNDATSKSVAPWQIITSLGLFITIYGLLFVLFIYLLDKKIKTGPEDENSEEGDLKLGKQEVLA